MSFSHAKCAARQQSRVPLRHSLNKKLRHKQCLLISSILQLLFPSRELYWEAKDKAQLDALFALISSAGSSPATIAQLLPPSLFANLSAFRKSGARVSCAFPVHVFCVTGEVASCPTCEVFQTTNLASEKCILLMTALSTRRGIVSRQIACSTTACVYMIVYVHGQTLHTYTRCAERTCSYMRLPSLLIFSSPQSSE